MKEQKSDKERKALVVVAILLLILLFLIFPKGVAYKLFVRPLLYLIWLADLGLRIVSQPILWAMFLICVVFFLLKSLFASKYSKRKLPRWGRQDVSGGRVADRLRLIRFARKWQYSRWKLAHDMTNLVFKVLAFREGIEPSHVQNRLKNGSLNIDQDIQAYLRTGLQREMTPQASLLTRIKQKWRRQDEKYQLDNDLEPVIAFLEEQLGIQDGRKHP